MSTPMIHRANATADVREAIRGFLATAESAGYTLRSADALLPLPLSGHELEALLDQQFGIDRAQLNSERASQLYPGANCACGD